MNDADVYIGQLVRFRGKIPGARRATMMTGTVTNIYTLGATHHAYVRTRYGTFAPKVSVLEPADAISRLGRLAGG